MSSSSFFCRIQPPSLFIYSPAPASNTWPKMLAFYILILICTYILILFLPFTLWADRKGTGSDSPSEWSLGEGGEKGNFTSACSGDIIFSGCSYHAYAVLWLKLKNYILLVNDTIHCKSITMLYTMISQKFIITSFNTKKLLIGQFYLFFSPKIFIGTLGTQPIFYDIWTDKWYIACCDHLLLPVCSIKPDHYYHCTVEKCTNNVI